MDFFGLRLLWKDGSFRTLATIFAIALAFGTLASVVGLQPTYLVPYLVALFAIAVLGVMGAAIHLFDTRAWMAVRIMLAVLILLSAGLFYLLNSMVSAVGAQVPL